MKTFQTFPEPARGRSTCTFFRLLWSCDECPGRDGSQQRAWVTEQKHVSGAPTYDSRKYVIAKATQLVLVHQYASMCDGEPCIRTDAEYTLECMKDEGNDKYRMRRLAHGFVPLTSTVDDSAQMSLNVTSIISQSVTKIYMPIFVRRTLAYILR